MDVAIALSGLDITKVRSAFSDDGALAGNEISLAVGIRDAIVDVYQVFLVHDEADVNAQARWPCDGIAMV